MTRCFSFPPPGCVRNESLIESIKGAKDEVKKDRKHKKEKKRKDREDERDQSKRHRHKRRRKEDTAIASKKVDDRRDNQVEFLEKSCLTVELELQTSSQNSCDSTFQFIATSVRVQVSPLVVDITTLVSLFVFYLSGLFASRVLTLMTFFRFSCYGFEETRIWIGLPHKGPKNPVVKDRKQSSSQEILDASHAAPRVSVGHSYLTSANEAPRDALRACQEKRRDPIFCSSREIKAKLSKEKKATPMKDNRKVGIEKMPSSSLCTQPEQEKPPSSYQETVGPSKLLCGKCPPSEWWLFVKFGATRRCHQVSNQKASQGSGSMVWPTARFLPDAELHALPFTVPF